MKITPEQVDIIKTGVFVVAITSGLGYFEMWKSLVAFILVLLCAVGWVRYKTWRKP